MYQAGVTFAVITACVAVFKREVDQSDSDSPEESFNLLETYKQVCV